MTPHARRPMRVLVTESAFGSAAGQVRRLRGLGLPVDTCHGPVGLCRATAPGGRCPLDDTAYPVDLVVDVRGVEDTLTTREYGVVCAVRAGKPVFVVGADPLVRPSAPTGLESRVTVCGADHLADALSAV